MYHLLFVDHSVNCVQQGHSFWNLIDAVARSDEHEQLTDCVTLPGQSLRKPLCVQVDLESKAHRVRTHQQCIIRALHALLQL